MAREMKDDEVMDYVFKKLFGDIDGIHAQSMFPGEDGTEEDGGGVVEAVNDQDHLPDAMKSYKKSDGGVDQDKEAVMEGAREGSRDPQDGDMDRGTTINESMDNTDDTEEIGGGGKKKKLKGLGKYSNIMAQLHGDD
jgi:hypothetical protein